MRPDSDADFVPDDVFIGAVRRGVARHRRRVRRRASAAVALLAIVAGSGAWYVDDRLSQVQRVDLGVDPSVPDPVAAGTPFNVLLSGTDGCDPSPTVPLDICAGRATGEHLSDSISILRVDPEADTLDLVGIPRDLWLPERRTKISSLTVPELIDEMESLLGIRVDHYASITMTGFRDLADRFGLRLSVPVAVRDRSTGLDLAEGCSTLDGAQVLALVRSRHLEFRDGDRWVTDPTGDLGRIERQQLVMRAVLEQWSSAGLTDAAAVSGVLDEVTIDNGLSAADLARFAEQARSATLRTATRLPTRAGGSEAISYQSLGDPAEVNAVIAPLGGRVEQSAEPRSVDPALQDGIDAMVGFGDIGSC